MLVTALEIDTTTRILCPLHISRSDAPIGLRCSRRQIGRKPSDVTSAPNSHWPSGTQCVHSIFASVSTSRYGERVFFITTLSCVVHVRLPIGLRRRAVLILLYPLHISAIRYFPIGHRVPMYSEANRDETIRRRASAPHSIWPNGAQCMHSIESVGTRVW